MAVSIHQFLPAAALGDGVSGGALFTQKLLRQLGVHSNIYAASYPATVGVFCPLDAFDLPNCDLLLVHHSMGHELEGWINAQSCSKVLIYHNITPAHYFSKGSPEYNYSLKGRRQLASWVNNFVGAIGDSPYNTEELLALGYSSVTTLPLLVELERFSGAETLPKNIASALDRPFILSVGRVAENKRPHTLIEALWHLANMLGHEQVPRLVLVGGTTSPDYERALRGYAKQLGLQDVVYFAGKLDDAELRWLYARAAAYWCASEHEGFCIPLVEAGFFQRPVISFSSSNIPDTLGAAGLLLDDVDPCAMAAVTAELMADVSLQIRLKGSGLKNLERYQATTLLPQLRHYLLGLNLGLGLLEPSVPCETCS